MNPTLPHPRKTMNSLFRLAVCLTLLLGGCGIFNKSKEPQPPEPPKAQPIPVTPPNAMPLPVNSTPPAQNAPAPASLPQWAERSLRADVSSPLPQTANSRVQAIFLARRAANDDALRSLAAQLADLPAPGGGKVADLLNNRPELRAEVENAMRQGIVFAPWRDDGGTSYKTSATLLLQPIAMILFGQPPVEP